MYFSGSRKRRDVSHDEQYAEIPNKLIGKNVRIPGALLPFSKTLVSNLSKAELQVLNFAICCMLTFWGLLLDCLAP